MTMMAKEILVCVILLLVGIAILATVHIYMARRVSMSSRDEENINAANIRASMQSNRRKKTSMTEDEINQLPFFMYNDEEREIECAVCLENFKTGDICRLLPNCKHNFHVQCIDPWLSTASVCPICRTGTCIVKVESEPSETGVELM